MCFSLQGSLLEGLKMEQMRRIQALKEETMLATWPSELMVEVLSKETIPMATNFLFGTRLALFRGCAWTTAGVHFTNTVYESTWPCSRIPWHQIYSFVYELTWSRIRERDHVNS